MANIDNLEAQNLYTSIEEDKRVQKQLAQEKAEKERIAQKEQAEIQKAEKEKADREAYDKSIKVITKNNFSGYIGLNLVGFEFSQSALANTVYNSGLNVRYELGASGGVRFSHPYVNVGLDAFWNIAPFALTGSIIDNIVNARLTFALPKLTKKFALTGGYTYWVLSSTGTAFFTKLGSPFIGVGVADVTFGKNFSADLFADWNMISIYESMIDFSFSVNMSLTYYLPFKLGPCSFCIKNNTGFSTLFVKSTLEWNLDTSFSIGVLFNDTHK